MAIQIYYNPLDTACKSVVGAVRVDERVQLNIYLFKDSKKPRFGDGAYVDNLQRPKLSACQKPKMRAYLHVNKDGQQAESFDMQQTRFGWSVTCSIKTTGLFYYTFYIENEGFVSCGYLQTGVMTSYPRGFLLTVTSADYTTPDWFKGGVMYQIFPDRFCKQGTMPDIKGRIAREDWGGMPSYKPNEQGKVLNNDFFGGNFKGIQSKLPYLKDLGVTVIYLNPIFEAASNHRYDTSNYMEIDPILGTEKDFDELVKAAKKQGIHIILDGVFNHTGDDSLYFNKYGNYPSIGAYQSKDSPYYSWYTFRRFPDSYESWWGIDILPEVNEQSPEYQNFIFNEGGVLKKWLSFGIGGYRLDVADELPDFFLKKLRKSVKESSKDAIIIGEVWEDASNKIAYATRREYLQGYELDSVMNYPLKDGIIAYMQTGNATRLLNTIRILIDHYPKQTVDCLMNILGTHDTVRILSVLGGIFCNNKDEMAKSTARLSKKAKESAIEKLKMAAVLQFTLPGVPCVYYGDENGQEGHSDPFCRQCFDWNALNDDLISFYQALGNVRKEYKTIFKDGIFQELKLQDGLLYFKRENEKGDCVYVYVNNSSKRYTIELPKPVHELLQNKTYEKTMAVLPYSYAVFVEE